jgi:hypothetical protein
LKSTEHFEYPVATYSRPGWAKNLLSSTRRLYTPELDKLESLTGESFSCEN